VFDQAKEIVAPSVAEVANAEALQLAVTDEVEAVEAEEVDMSCLEEEVGGDLA